MNPTTEMRWEKVELPVQKYGSPCKIDPRRAERARRQNPDIRRSRTFRAADRLARYRLIAYLRDHRLTVVDDTYVDVVQRHEYGDWMVFASVLAVAVPSGVTLPDGFRMPERRPYLSVIRERQP